MKADQTDTKTLKANEGFTGQRNQESCHVQQTRLETLTHANDSAEGKSRSEKKLIAKVNPFFSDSIVISKSIKINSPLCTVKKEKKTPGETRKINGLSTLSFGLGWGAQTGAAAALFFLFFFLLGSAEFHSAIVIITVITAAIALAAIATGIAGIVQSTSRNERGNGLAITGIVLGILGLLELLIVASGV